MAPNDFLAVMKAFSEVLPWRAPDFSKHTVSWFWYEEFKQYALEDIKKGIRTWIAKSDHFPSICDFHGVLGNIRTSDEILAQTAATSIIAAVRRFGWCNAQEALEYIGDVGKKIVAMHGGWSAICETVTDENITYFTHQLRETGMSVVKTNGHCLPQLPEKTSRLVTQIMEAVEVEYGEKKRIGDTKRNLKLAIKQEL